MDNSFGSYLKTLRVNHNLSINELGVKSGVDIAYISRIERGLQSAPSPKIIAKLATALNTDYYKMLELANYLPSYRDNDKSSDTMNKVPIPESPTLRWVGYPHAVPVYGRVPCGTPVEVASYQIGTAMAYDPRTDYILEVSGDSMAPEINEGELVEVQAADKAEPNQAVVILTEDGETTLKYFVIDHEKGPVLRSRNPKYEDIPVHGDVRVQGVVIGVKKPMPRYKADRQEASSKEEKGKTIKHRRMIGPELAFSKSLEAATKRARFKFDNVALETNSTIPPDGVAALLGLAPDEQALKRTMVQHFDGIPYRIVTSWMPKDLFADILTIQESQDKPLFELLEEIKGIYPVKIEERVRSVNLSPYFANVLKIEPNSSGLEIQRVVHADNGRILEVAFIVAAGDRWELAYKYPAGGRTSAPDWSWLQYSPAEETL